MPLEAVCSKSECVVEACPTGCSRRGATPRDPPQTPRDPRGTPAASMAPTRRIPSARGPHSGVLASPASPPFYTFERIITPTGRSHKYSHIHDSIVDRNLPFLDSLGRRRFRTQKNISNYFFLIIIFIRFTNYIKNMNKYYISYSILFQRKFLKELKNCEF